MTGANAHRRAPARRRTWSRLRLPRGRRARRSAPATRSPAPPSRSSPRSRSATSSSSAPATPSRSGRATSTRTGVEQPIWMGSYGIGPARIVAAAVEQFADEHGISWPRALAPFAVHLVALGKPGTPERDAADALYETLRGGGVEVLYDDRDAGTGEKFADAELLGCPLRLTVGRRSLESGEIEVQLRRGRQEAPGLALDGRARASSCGRWTSCGRERPLSARRLLGLDRSGPPPPQTQAGQPLRPWTIPNAIGFAAPGADPGVPGRRALQQRRHRRAAGDAVRGDRLGRLRRRHRRARDRPVQPPRRADGPRHRPPARDLRRGRLLALSSCCRAGRSRCSPRASC